MKVLLYTRRDCGLCDEALETLRDYGLTPIAVDIDEHPDLKGQFDQCVPVVEIDGRIRFRGRVEPLLLRRILSGNDSGER